MTTTTVATPPYRMLNIETKECNLCKNIGRIEPVEIVPSGGILFECRHPDGTLHEWASFSGLDNLRSVKTDRLRSEEIECPQCNRNGLIKTERLDLKRPDRYSYRISHPDGSYLVKFGFELLV